jgi:murein DD-endopeptidase MepM/ murein hydrolase activator NlpD
MRLSYQRAVSQNPKLQSNVISRFRQKQKIRRQYAKAARDSGKAARRAKAAGSVTTRAAKALSGVIRRHPFAAVIVLLAFLFLGILLSLFGLASGMGGSSLNGILGGAYLADNAEINSAETAYTEWETDLREEIENAETDHPGYDEYRYEIDGIGHDPLALMAYLTAEYLDYSFAAIESELRAIFDEQYVLTFEESVETRYRDPDDSDGDGDYEPYDWRILTVKLETTPLTDILDGYMDEEKRGHYDALMDTNGGRQYAGSPFAFDWTANITSYYGWRPDPYTGEKSFHTGIDIGVPTGTPIIAAHDGVVTKVVNGTTGYGKYIVIEGEDGISSRYAHCDALLAAVGQEVKQGDAIAASGDTGNSTGPHLHFEIMVDGETLNPIYFASGDAA